MKARLVHPGPPSSSRILSARGTSRSLTVMLPAGAVLMEAVAEAMDVVGSDSGVMVLDGLEMGDYNYVMPGPSPDDTHAAWYSEKHQGKDERLHHATAIIGKRGSDWWLHCHGLWNVEGDARCGHLLPDEVVLAKDATVTLHTFDGGAFSVQYDKETNFDIFHAIGGLASGNAVIAKFAPHEDTAFAIARLARKAGFTNADVYGIGSLDGANFEQGKPMLSPISEVLITPNAQLRQNNLRLPVYCVDPDDGRFFGDLEPGAGLVCVTFEVLIVDAR